MATNTPFGQRLGLVLEGGAMRGIYTAGVLDVFLEAGIMWWGFRRVRCTGAAM